MRCSIHGTPAGAARPGAGAQRVLAKPSVVAGTLVIQDSAEVNAELDPELANRGVRIMGLDRAVREVPELVQRALLSTRSDSPDLFAGLHEAYMSGGAFVFVPRGVVVEKPIQIVQAATEPGQSMFPHTLVVAEAGADVTVLETYCGDERVSEALASTGVELIPADNARIQYVSSQEWPSEMWHFSSAAARRTRQQRSLDLCVHGRQAGQDDAERPSRRGRR